MPTEGGERFTPQLHHRKALSDRDKHAYVRDPSLPPSSLPSVTPWPGILGAGWKYSRETFVCPGPFGLLCSADEQPWWRSSGGAPCRLLETLWGKFLWRHRRERFACPQVRLLEWGWVGGAKGNSPGETWAALEGPALKGPVQWGET